MTRVRQLITTSGVARRLGVTPSTVTRWAADGLLPCIVLPSGVRRFSVADVEQMLEPLATESIDDGDCGESARSNEVNDSATQHGTGSGAA